MAGAERRQTRIPPTTNHQPPTTNHQPQPPTTNHQPQPPKQSMRSRAAAAALITFLLAASRPGAQTEPAPEARLAARQWLRDAKLGMFVHWGVYSQLGQGEWVMHNRSIPVRN